MTWQVTYRGADRRQITEDIEAESREALFGILRKRGINAIKIAQTEIHHRLRRRAPRSRTVVAQRIVVWAVVGLLAASAGLYLAMRQTPKSNDVTEPEKASRQSRITEAPSVLPTPKSKVEPTPEPPAYVEVNGRRVYRNPTNDVGRVVTNAFGKALVIERVVSPNGPMKNGQSIAPRRIFTYDSEVAIDTLMNMDVGYKSLMMLPADMDQDFMNSLTAKIEIGPDDTEDEIRRKNQMIETKKELAQRVANGEKVSQIAAETLAYYNKIATLRDNLQQEIIEMENNGATGDELEDVYEAANLMLKEYDALPLHSPKVRKAIIRERLERKKARQQNR
jgi:hypothetical protein